MIEAVLRRWDPEGVSPGELAPLNEYNDFAPDIAALIKGRCTIWQLALHLQHLRTRALGLAPQPKRDLETAREIISTVCAESPAVKALPLRKNIAA